MSPNPVYLLLCTLLLQQRTTKAIEDYFFCPTDQRPIPKDYVCDGYNDCANGSDEQDCGSGLQCQPYEMACASDGICLNLAFKCDGYPQCADKSDERECSSRECDKEDELKCGDGQCISKLLACDGTQDCSDGADELNCAKSSCDPSTEWTCSSGSPQCISHNWLCDSEKDCSDGSDEMNCDSFSNPCSIGMFNCSSTECIDGNNLCDGFADCSENGADEDESICYVLNCDPDKDFACPERCISKDHVCDGEYDCIDNSDEVLCDSKCSPDQFACITGSCINSTYRCNGNEDCTDGSDEFLCDEPDKVKCGQNEFPCVDGLQCIPEFSRCDPDHLEQCKDGSDEWNCDSVNDCNISTNGGCQHKCHNTTYNYYCSCYDGYRLNITDMSSCSDINECEETPGICTHYCLNTQGSYACSCDKGYMLSTKYGCKASGPAAYLLFTNWFDIQKVATRGNFSDILLRQLRNAAALDYHYSMGYVYWTDIIRHTIMRANINGSGIKEIINTGVDRPEGIAVDWIHDHIYWTDSSLKRIEVANLDGLKRAVLFSDLHSPKDIIVDPVNRWLYWTARHQIVRSSLDGTQKEVILSNKNHIYWPRSLTLDHPTQMLYWVDAASKSIGSSSINGSNQHTVLSANISNPSGITVFENKIYWAEKDGGIIYSVDKRNGGQMEPVLTEVYSPVDLVMVHPLRQPHDATDSACSGNDNYGCQHLCLPGQGNVTCKCPPSSYLRSDQKTCSKSSLFILFSMSQQLFMISLETTVNYEVELPIVNTTLSPLANIISIDWANDTVFWLDSTLPAIFSASFDGFNPVTIADADLHRPFGIAVDWIGNKVYWTDDIHLFASEMDGSSKSVLFTADTGQELKDIVVNPTEGMMYFGIKGIKNSHIKQAYLDGTHVKTLFNNKEGVPEHLTLDYQSNRLYWIDSRHLNLETIYLNGSDHHILLNKHGELSNAIGLANYGDKIYWTDSVDDSIKYVDKSPPYTGHDIIRNRENVRGLTIYHEDRPTSNTHPCRSNNGGCSHLCFGIPTSGGVELSVSCNCPTGYLLNQDKKTCRSYLNNYLIFASDTRIGRVSLDKNTDVDITIPINPPPINALGVDVDFETNDIYWIDSGVPGIYKIPFNGGSRETIIDCGLVRPTALAIDWVGRLLYWADSSTRRIEVSHLNGTNRHVLFHDIIVSEVTSMALDIKKYHIYWSSSTTSRIIRGEMDGGTTPLSLINARTITNPLSIALDDSKLYVSDNVKSQILSFSKDGSGQNVIAGSSYPKGIAVDENYVYWVDHIHSILYKALKDSKTNNQSPVRMVTRMKNVNDLKLVSRDRWLARGGLHHHCDNGNKCTNLCLPNHSVIGYKCACSTGIKLNLDQRSCPSIPTLYLLFVTFSSIRRISEDTSNFFDVCFVNNIKNVNHIDFHFHSAGSGKIFWADHAQNSIMSSNFDGSSVQKFIANIISPRGLSVDRSTGNIYYIHGGRVPRIEVMVSIGLFRKVLVEKNLINPTSLVVYPQRGLMYWIDLDKNNVPYIVQSRMDGSNVITLINSSTEYHPFNLAIDTSGDYLYWTDTLNNSIRRLSLDRENETEPETVVENIKNPGDITVYSNFVYWSNRTSGQIQRYDISTRRYYTMYSNKGAGAARGLKMIFNDKGTSSCSNHNYCTHLCLPISPATYHCSCPDNVATNCNEHVGTVVLMPTESSTQSFVDAPPTITPTSVLFTATPSTTNTVPVVSYGDQNLIGIFTNGELTILVMICVLLVAVVFIVILIITLYIKYKSDKEIVSTTLTVKNSLNIKRKISSSEYSAQKLGFTPNSLPKLNNYPSTQLNNVGGLKARKKEKNLVEKKSNVIEIKQKENSYATKEANPNIHESLASESEEPQEYRITPVQVRRQLSSLSSTPPHSPPKLVTADVHEEFKVPPPAPPTHKKKHRIPPPIPIEKPPPPCCEQKKEKALPEPRPVLLRLSVKKKVTFDTEGSPEPPPLPPRSCTPVVSTPTAAPIPPVTQFPVPVSPPPESITGPVFPPPESANGPVSPPFAAINPLFQSTDVN